jgi:hypothetical protein
VNVKAVRATWQQPDFAYICFLPQEHRPPAPGSSARSRTAQLAKVWILANWDGISPGSPPWSARR